MTNATESLDALFLDPIDARIAEQARALDQLINLCRVEGRTVPASVQDTVDNLWRWANGALAPRGRRPRAGRLTGPYRDVPLPGIEPFDLNNPDA